MRQRREDRQHHLVLPQPRLTAEHECLPPIARLPIAALAGSVAERAVPAQRRQAAGAPEKMHAVFASVGPGPRIPGTATAIDLVGAPIEASDLPQRSDKTAAYAAGACQDSCVPSPQRCWSGCTPRKNLLSRSSLRGRERPLAHSRSSAEEIACNARSRASGEHIFGALGRYRPPAAESWPISCPLSTQSAIRGFFEQPRSTRPFIRSDDSL